MMHLHNARSAFALSIAVTLGFAAVEVAAGLLAGSLALVADAGHMLVDAAGLLLALAAAQVARRPSDARRTYGYARAEVLVVPLQVLIMLGLAAYLIFEAVDRAGRDVDIAALPVLVVGALGLAVNLGVMRLLAGHAHENLNARAARLEVVVDALGSVAVVASAAVILSTGWTPIDLVISLLIGAAVVPRAGALLVASIGILLESTPRGLSPEAIERDARTVPGVAALHDLHVWTLAPGFVALSAHVEVPTMGDSARAITGLARLFRESYGIDHVTLQPETRDLHEAIACCESFPDLAALGSAHRAHDTPPSLPHDRRP